MGPGMMAISTAVTAATTAATAVMGAKASSDAAKAQQEWADRQATEEQAAGQRQAAQELKQAKAAKSRLMAVAGASGSGASDPTVMDIWGDIDTEGRVNAGVAQAMSQQKADGITYQAALDRWKADAQKKITNVSAIGTILGGGLKAGSEWGKSRMAMRYGGGYGGYGTGYGT